MKTIEINLNDTVYVKLSAKAHEALERDYNEIMKGWKCLYRRPEEDTEGWSKWQLWDLMQRIGPNVRFDGREPIIATTIRVEQDE